MTTSAISFAGDDDDDDDFFLGNIEEDIYQETENVYVDAKPARIGAETPKVDIGDAPDSDSDCHNEKQRTSDIESDTSDVSGLAAPSNKYSRATSGRQRNKKKNSISSDVSTASTPEMVRSDSTSPQPNTKRQKCNNAMASFLEPDENEEFFREIAKEARKIPSCAKESTPEQPRRIYNVRFLSKLDGTMNKAIQMKTLGKYDFSSILPSVLNGFVKEYGIPTIMKKTYNVDDVTLYWNNAKLLNFMTCNSLKISQAFENEISDVEITVVSKEYERKFEEDTRLKLLEEEQAAAKELLAIRESEISLNKDDKTNRDIEEFEKELKSSKENNRKLSGFAQNKAIEYIDLEDDDKIDTIKLALMGQDNKKLYVNVRTSTPFSKLADYYKSHKQLPKKTKLKLIFDHDELDSKRTVGEEEMEEEDMIEVVIG